MPVDPDATAASGCPSRPSGQSKNKRSPFRRSVGLTPAVFALGFSPGPEPKPWDNIMGYPRVFGRTDVNNVEFSNYGGAAACGGAGSYAIHSHPAVCYGPC